MRRSMEGKATVRNASVACYLHPEFEKHHQGFFASCYALSCNEAQCLRQISGSTTRNRLKVNERTSWSSRSVASPRLDWNRAVAHPRLSFWLRSTKELPDALLVRLVQPPEIHVPIQFTHDMHSSQWSRKNIAHVLEAIRGHFVVRTGSEVLKAVDNLP
jgi:hypothetical protein